MIRIITIIAAAILVQVLALYPATAPSAHADWYRWVDDDGKLHITDDIGTIPDEKRFEMEVFKVTPRKERPEARQPAPELVPDVQAPGAGNGGSELYGGETLRWWKEKFVGLNMEISDLEASIEEKQRFVDIFLSGRRLGQIYGEDDIRVYESYSAELPGDRESLKRLTLEREELKRKARVAGVPKDVREQLESVEEEQER